MKRFIALILFLLLIAPSAAFAGLPYGIFIMESPDQDLPHLQVRGVQSQGQFTASVFDRLDQPINRLDIKGVFGKIDPNKNKAQFEWMQVYDPPTVGWSMGFLGMAEDGLTTSFLFEKYQTFGDTPPNSQILEWSHFFNSVGFSDYTDIHINQVMQAITEGEPAWGQGFVTDINTNNRCVGWFDNGDAFAFNTTTGKFEYKFLKNTGPWGSAVSLWSIADNSWTVGIGKRPGSNVNEIVIFQVTSTAAPRWLKDEDAEVVPSPHVMGTWSQDPFVGDVAINGISEIAFIGQLAGASPGVVSYNFNTGAKEMLIEWTDDVIWADYTNYRLTEISNENVPIIAGYMTRIADGVQVGFIAYPK